ncbi:hypothetical protein N7509_007056 [Penicillium cosmopolitanum]|uniref:Uncharacterized protein n=1 Tax=Penicillium cosmopolitanum TaxID=1131564 RepID=A0A9X0B827_9EURO|nr:uncharacterized protein N7509_007056 [Penicillium cosmopolitanum]KAJ5391566.1 hypothetical protein N7509_007056 [Penicillium cosmopolitanum]
MKLSIFGRSVTKSRLHIIIGGLVFLVFILTVARLAVKGTPSTRANTWGIAVGSTKANMILNIVDTIFWLALFIITIMGSIGAASEASRALGGIIATLAATLL